MVFLGYINLLTIKSSILYKDIVKCSDFKDKIFDFFFYIFGGGNGELVLLICFGFGSFFTKTHWSYYSTLKNTFYAN